MTAGNGSAPDWRTIDWREHLTWVPAGGTQVNVVDMAPAHPTGPPLVLIHGLSSNWQAWIQNIPSLARHRRVIALDLPGFGHSPMPPDGITIAGYGRIVAEVCDALGVERAAIAGNSMGGFIGAEMAIEMPERVAALILVSAAAFWGEKRRAKPQLAVAQSASALLAWFAARADRSVHRPRLRRFALFQGGIRRDLPADLAGELVSGAGTEGFLDALGELAGYSVRDRMPEIACPTLVVWGRRDPLVSVRDADEYVRLIPDARKEIFADSGHVAMVEEPARFNALVEAFLAEAAGLRAVLSPPRRPT